MLACFTKDPAQRPTVDDLLLHPWMKRRLQSVYCQDEIHKDTAKFISRLRLANCARTKRDLQTGFGVLQKSRLSRSTPAENSPKSSISSLGSASRKSNRKKQSIPGRQAGKSPLPAHWTSLVIEQALEANSKTKSTISLFVSPLQVDKQWSSFPQRLHSTCEFLFRLVKQI